MSLPSGNNPILPFPGLQLPTALINDGWASRKSIETPRKLGHAESFESVINGGLTANSPLISQHAFFAYTYSLATSLYKGELKMAKRVVIDTDECTGCETCVELCAEVFAFNEDEEKAEVIMPEGGPEDCIEEAIESCPVECIHWEE
jgi:ferredoxin